VFNHIFSRYMA